MKEDNGDFILINREVLDSPLWQQHPVVFGMFIIVAGAAWRGPGVSPEGLMPGEAFWTRPKGWKKKAFAEARTWLEREGYLIFRELDGQAVAFFTRSAELWASPGIERPNLPEGTA